MTPETSRSLAAFIAVGALLAGAAQHFLGGPARAARAAAHSLAEDARSSLAAVSAGVVHSDPDAERLRLTSLSERATALGRAAREPEALLSGIHRIAGAHRLRVDSVRPGQARTRAPLTQVVPTPADPTAAMQPTTPAEPDTSITCEITLRGDYAGIVRFLDGLSELGWHRIVALRIAPTGNADGEPTEARIEIELFDFEPPAPPTSTPPNFTSQAP